MYKINKHSTRSYRIVQTTDASRLIANIQMLKK